ncbi:Periplasmic protein TonB [Caenispirillum salinarum AK4]|uniref:Periplasmic protein TonB n=1 Tax=Caenispirillum salinarum AK4 TaxID=1238182 RepID=K9GVH6_9PROT|nr:Periplasmic protein TonB [Caenispirillum salinarum]EKV29985.1 Periplasmic protein TonB [Caenispirillum salinarum AK4]
MIRPAAILWGTLALGVGTGLFVLKVEVQALEDKLTRLNAQIRSDRAAVHVLEAEWSYLNDPARLRDQAQRLLGMSPFAPSQVNSIAQLPLRPAPPPPEAAPEPETAPVPGGPAGPMVRVPAAPAAEELASAPVHGGTDQ